MPSRLTVLLYSSLAIFFASSALMTEAEESVKTSRAADTGEVNSIAESALRLHKQERYQEAEVEYKRALALVPPNDYRVYDLNASLLSLYTTTKQLDKLQGFLHNNKLLNQFTTRKSAYWTSALVISWMERGFYSEARELAAKLIPQLEWGDKPFEQGPWPTELAAGCYKSLPLPQWLPSYNLLTWTETCNNHGRSEEIEKLYDACIKSALNSGKGRTEDYVVINSLAADQSFRLNHFDKGLTYFNAALEAGRHLEKPLFGELFSAVQILLPRNVDFASELYTKLFPYVQDKVYLLTIKLDLAKEFAKQNQKEKAQLLASEVNEEIRRDIKNPAVNAAYDKYFKDSLRVVPTDARVTVFLDKLMWFPSSANYENGIREINDFSVLKALKREATKTGDSACEKDLLIIERGLLGNTQTKRVSATHN